jgi:lysophospholipase L1-like esterase
MLAVIWMAAALGAYPQAQAPAATDRWAEAMAAFAQADAEMPPPKRGVVFVGSSSIRLWDLAKHFPGMPAVNRGFGGSQIEDSIRHADLLVARHAPRLVVLYAGDNDLSSGKTPRQVADDFTAFVRAVRTAVPDVRIAFVGIKPSIARWEMVGKVREANALIRTACEADERLAFVDVDGPMIGWNGQPRRELFVADGLHLSEQGYELWSALLRPLVR